MSACRFVETDGSKRDIFKRFFPPKILIVSFQQAEIHEKSHVLYILNILKDTIRTNSDEPPHRLPSYTTLILMHALRGIFYPSNFIYPLTARFLLQRPELDTKDVPMLYGMLYSSSDDWKKERGWIIRFLSDGMMSTEDWRVLKRRHTWELLASLYQSSQGDVVLRQSILEVGSPSIFFLCFSYTKSILFFFTSSKRFSRILLAMRKQRILLFLNLHFCHGSRFNCYILPLRVLRGLEFWKIFLLW